MVVTRGISKSKGVIKKSQDTPKMLEGKEAEIGVDIRDASQQAAPDPSHDNSSQSAGTDSDRDGIEGRDNISDDDLRKMLLNIQSAINSMRSTMSGLRDKMDDQHDEMNQRMEELENYIVDEDSEGNIEESPEVVNGDGNGLDEVLKFCGLTEQEASLFRKRAATNWQEICQISNASELIKTLNKSNSKDMFIDPRSSTRIKVLVHWAKWNNMTKEQSFNGQDFQQNYHHHYTRWDNCQKLKSEASKIPVPDTLDTKKWKEWLRSVTNYLASIYNEIGVPLIYTVWELLGLEDKTGHELTQMERFYMSTRREGVTFQTDSTRVHQIIMNCLSDSEAYPWVAKQAKGTCGRKLLLALSDHYDGQVSMVIRAQQALASIKNASWSHEYTFSFEKYSKKLKEAFDDLDRAKRGKTEVEKVEILLDGMKDKAADIVFAINSVRSVDKYKDNFMAATDYLKQAVERVYPPRSVKASRRISALKGKKKEKKQDKVNGVDVSNWNREFTNEEWGKLPVNLRKKIAKSPGRAKKRQRENQDQGTKDSGQQNKKFTSWKAKISEMNSTDRVEISAGDLIEMLGGDSPSEIEECPLQTVDGRYVFKASTGKRVTFTNGTSSNLKLSGTIDQDKNTRRIGKLMTRNRRTIMSYKSQVMTQKDGHMAPVEIDNHADTCCLGSNFRLMTYTNQVCTVNGFLDGMEETDIPIVTGATAWVSPNGDKYILVVNQGLWFGNKLEKSLLNPNQVRHHGLSLCDDPTDPNRVFGLDTMDQGIIIPFFMDGTIAAFDTYCPTEAEVEDLPHIEITSEEDWDPNSILFPRHQKNMVIKSIQRGTRPNLVMGYETQEIVRDNIHPTVELVNRLVYNVQVNSTSSERHHKITAEELARKWAISLKTAERTLSATTQYGIRSAIMPLSKRYRAGKLLLRHTQKLKTTFYTDTFKGSTKSLVGNEYGQLFAGDKVIYVDSCKSKHDVYIPLKNFLNDVGHPMHLVFDKSKEQVLPGTEFQKLLRQNPWIHQHNSEEYTPNQNFAELEIGILKRKIRNRRVKHKIPKKLWDFHARWEAEILSRTVRSECGRTGMEIITGETPDISEWTDFGFYDYVWFWYQPGKDDNPMLGRWLGVANRTGGHMCYWVIDRKGMIHSRTTVQHAIEEDFMDPLAKKDRDEFDRSLLQSLDEVHPDDTNFESFAMEDEDDIVPADGELFKQEAEEEDPESNYGYDQLVNAEFNVPSHDGSMIRAKVKRRYRDSEGNTVGNFHPNPLMNTVRYEVEREDGVITAYNANTIAENLLSQVDEEGRQTLIFSGIIDHKCDRTAIQKEDGFVFSKSGNKIPKKTTRGWKLLIEWKDGSQSWIPLAEIKGSNPVEVAEYAVANRIDDQPAFNWWVRDTLRRRDRIISKVKSRYWKTTHKFGIRLPHSVEEAYRIDRETGTNFWTEAIQKEMKNVSIAFKKWDGSIKDARDGKHLIGYQEIKCHMIFDIKMDGKFTRKARFVAGGHTVEKPEAVATYSSVVSRDSVRIALLVAALNELDIAATDIGNAYLNAPCGEKIWTIAGPEFGELQGNVMIIVRALYGLSTSGKQWRDMLADTLRAEGYKSSQADEDVWIKVAHKESGEPYYEMILCYVDDLLHISHNPSILMEKLGTIYRLKDGYDTPSRYLGASIGKMSLEGGEAWFLSCDEYIHTAVENLEKELEKSNKALRGTKSSKRPYPASYRPELDDSQELDPDGANKFQQLIGILRWAVELGRLDIYAEVSMLSQFQCAPRQGHMEAIYYIFSYLKHNPNCRIVFSHLDHQTPKHEAHIVDWGKCYPDAKEELPQNMPKPLGNAVKITVYTDADHAGNLFNRRSHSGIVIFVNDAPIVWYSKRQNTVEASSFGSEFNALRIAVELIEELRYKLRMFGIPIAGPTIVLCDNRSVVSNASRPESTLKKRHNSICYHRVREAAAAGYIVVSWIEGKDNIADVFTKTTNTSDQRKHCLRQMLYFHNFGPTVEQKVGDKRRRLL